jgi:hypothetical protein
MELSFFDDGMRFDRNYARAVATANSRMTQVTTGITHVERGNGVWPLSGRLGPLNMLNPGNPAIPQVMGQKRDDRDTVPPQAPIAKKKPGGGCRASRNS